jgi:hypothetical protein
MIGNLLRTTGDAAIFAGIGYFYGQVARPSTNATRLTILIAATSKIATDVFFRIITRTWEDSNVKTDNYSIIKCVAIDWIVKGVAIFALRYFDLIANKGIIVLSSLTLLKTLLDVALNKEPFSETHIQIRNCLNTYCRELWILNASAS